MKKKILVGSALLLAVVCLYLIFFWREEVVTDAEFPAVFQPAAEYCKDKTGKELSFKPGQESEIQDALNSLSECTAVQFAAGRFVFNNSLTIANVNGITLQGAGKKATIIQFKDAGNGNGVDVESSNSFTIKDLTIIDSPKNGLEVRLSENIIIDNIVVTWSNTEGEAKRKNGAYGVYPVNVKNVLLQNTDSFYASDAGLYVGQCINAIVRYNLAEENVMGLEIENTVNADVYENTVRNNTGGLLVYDLNKNTNVTRNVRVFKNIVENNNNPNFGNAGIVKTVPAGVGFIITSARQVEIYDNTFAGNNSVDIALVNGLVSVAQDFGAWSQNNFRTHSIHIHSNTFNGGSGGSLDNGNPSAEDRPLGYLIDMIFKELNAVRKAKGEGPVPPQNIIYDGVDKGKTILVLTNSMFGNNPGNHNNICLQNNNKGKIEPSMIDINLPAVMDNSDEPTQQSIASAAEKGEIAFYTAKDKYNGAPEAGFDCVGFKGTGVPVQGLGDLK